MYYSSGNYEAFAHPRKPEGVDHKSAYLIGSGLAALTAACYLVRDGQMKGERIHIFEKTPSPAVPAMAINMISAMSCGAAARWTTCLLYTSDAADEEDSGDLRGRRIIKKKKKSTTNLSLIPIRTMKKRQRTTIYTITL